MGTQKERETDKGSFEYFVQIRRSTQWSEGLKVQFV